MNKIPYAGHLRGNGQMVLHINLTKCGQGWHSVEIPVRRRSQVLQAIERKINLYKSSSDYRHNIGPGHNIDSWLNDIITLTAA